MCIHIESNFKSSCRIKGKRQGSQLFKKQKDCDPSNFQSNCSNSKMTYKAII